MRDCNVRIRAQRQAQQRVTHDKAAHLPIGMVGATTAVVAITLMMTIAAGPIYALAERAAASLSDRSIYVNAVLDSGVPAPPGATSGAPDSTGGGG